MQCASDVTSTDRRAVDDLCAHTMSCYTFRPAPAVCADHDEVRLGGACLVQDGLGWTGTAAYNQLGGKVQTLRDVRELERPGSVCSS